MGHDPHDPGDRHIRLVDHLACFVFPPPGNAKKEQPKEAQMSITDKISGKAKQAAGTVTDNRSLKRSGRKEERKGEKKDELSRAKQRADAKAEEVADLERKTR